MNMNCPNCNHVVPVLLGAGAAAGPSDARVFESEPPGTRAALATPRLVLVKGQSIPPARSIEAVRRELLDAHRAHVDASSLEDAAEKCVRQARHNTVEKMGRITQLRTELVRLVETGEAEAAV